MDKIIRDGKVAVLYSPDFGAGWYTWGAPLELVFDPVIVDLVEKGKNQLIERYINSKGYDFYTGGASKLKIKWVPVGTVFKIEEYDGAESVEIRDLQDWIIA